MRLKAITAFVVGLGIAASLVLLIPSAYAGKANPLGANSDSGTDRTDGNISVTATDPWGNNLGQNATVYAGETITVNLNYHVVNADGNTWDGWLNLDQNYDICSNPAPNWATCFSGGNFSPDYNDQTPAPTGDNGNIEQNDNCPSFYDNFDSPFYDVAEVGFQNGADYPWSDPNPGASGHDTCLTQGLSVVWHGIHMTPSNSDKTYSVNFKINPDYAQPNHNFCFQGNISLGDVAAGGNNGGDLYYRTNSNSLCLLANVPTTISGYVASDPVAATGRNLASVPIDDCAGHNLATTVADGSFSFSTFEGKPFCMNSPAPPVSLDGTTYGSVAPYCASGQCTIASPNLSDHCWSSSCGNYAFIYTPQANPVPLSKSACTQPLNSCSTGSGGSLTPGQGMTFSMTGSNGIDSNTSGLDLEDEVPLNIDTGSVGSVSASIATVGGGPAGWSAGNTGLTCNGVSNPLSYGYSGFVQRTTNYVCGYTPPSGTGNPGHIYLAMSAIPAYSQVTLSWGGTVIAGPSVGVYPTNGAYCGNGAATDFRAPSSILANCSDFSAGLQGVSNFAYDYVNGNMTPSLSNNTYNPIPGTLNCVGKDSSDAKTEQGASLVVPPGACSDGPGLSITSPAPGDEWVYSTSDPNYKSADFRILVGLPNNQSQGPVYYSVIDQNDGAATTNSGAPLDPAFQNTSALSGGGQQAGPPGSQWLHWDGQNSAIVADPEYRFHVDFTNVSDGHVANNSVKACWPHYWTPGYPVSCVTMATPLTVTQQKITNPFVTTSNGDIHAGGGPGKCSTPATVQAAQNPGASGQWFVTASGKSVGGTGSTLTGASNKNPFFTSNAGTASLTYGTVCRPDVVTSTQNYAGKLGNTVAYNPSIWTNPAAQAAADGKVVVSNSNVDIPSGAIISSRFTLLVNGANVNVGGNITNAPIALNGQAETSHPSFGVVVNNGNLNIDKDVTQLDGFYFVAPDSGGANGLVNTCASPNGSTTLATSGPYTVQDCIKPLTVQGLMMANAFRLHRTTDPGASATNPAEYVKFDDRLYSATPPGFSNLSQTYLPPIYQPNTNPRY